MSEATDFYLFLVVVGIFLLMTGESAWLQRYFFDVPDEEMDRLSIRLSRWGYRILTYGLLIAGSIGLVSRLL